MTYDTPQSPIHLQNLAIFQRKNAPSLQNAKIGPKSNFPPKFLPILPTYIQPYFFTNITPFFTIISSTANHDQNQRH